LIPNWRLLAKTYPEAVQKVLDKILSVRGSLCYGHDGLIDEAHLREHAKKQEFFIGLGEVQKGHDLLVVPAQFGLRYCGKSVRRARAVMFGGECGLGAFEIGIMLLTHPERLHRYYDLWIYCPGDEFSSIGDANFSKSPYFRFDKMVEFGTNDIADVSNHCGSASAFRPVPSPQQ
jgi:hypothetical protein